MCALTVVDWMLLFHRVRRWTDSQDGHVSLWTALTSRRLLQGCDISSVVPAVLWRKTVYRSIMSLSTALNIHGSMKCKHVLYWSRDVKVMGRNWIGTNLKYKFKIWHFILIWITFLISLWKGHYVRNNFRKQKTLDLLHKSPYNNGNSTDMWVKTPSST